MKLSAQIRNNFWILNFKPIALLIGFFVFIIFSANFLLTLIQYLCEQL